jgi:hypothetical protein
VQSVYAGGWLPLPAPGYAGRGYINNAGEVVGSVLLDSESRTLEHATLWVGGLPSDLGTFNGLPIHPTGLAPNLSGSNLRTAPSRHCRARPFTYTPDSGFAGKDSFTFRVSDSAGSSSIGTISVSVSRWRGIGPERGEPARAAGRQDWLREEEQLSSCRSAGPAHLRVKKIAGGLS